MPVPNPAGVEQMINIKLTSISGTEKIVAVDTIKHAIQYAEELPARLKKGSRVRIDCDIAGINGWITGTHPTG